MKAEGSHGDARYKNSIHAWHIWRYQQCVMACRGVCMYRTQTCLQVVCILIQIACIPVRTHTQTPAVVVCMHADDMRVLTCVMRLCSWQGHCMVGETHFLLMTARSSF